jgi:glutamate-1-semialdehyde 2,1-aminomutase
VLPGGETRAVTTFLPYPVVITEGHGARLTDVDGHSYLDPVNNYTAMVELGGEALRRRGWSCAWSGWG